MEFSGDYVVVDGYRFKGFNRRGFDNFEVINNASPVTMDLFMSMQGREVELVSTSNCQTHSRATVKLLGAPVVDGRNITAEFGVVYYSDELTREMKPKGGYLEYA